LNVVHVSGFNASKVIGFFSSVIPELKRFTFFVIFSSVFPEPKVERQFSAGNNKSASGGNA
jgi:hypothetical protein